MALIEMIKSKLKQTFHKCNAVQEVYPKNIGDIRIVECIECGKLHLMNKNEKVLREARIKSFRNISIYIKNKK